MHLRQLNSRICRRIKNTQPSLFRSRSYCENSFFLYCFFQIAAQIAKPDNGPFIRPPSRISKSESREILSKPTIRWKAAVHKLYAIFISLKEKEVRIRHTFICKPPITLFTFQSEFSRRVSNSLALNGFVGSKCGATFLVKSRRWTK